jgi:D-serine dehydratase
VILSADDLMLSLPDPLLDGSVKGWPPIGIRASELEPGQLTLADLPTPVLTVREDAVSANVTALADWCLARGTLLAPHAKTTMAPALLRRQLARGAWGLTVADSRQARVAIASGARNVLIANEMITPHDLSWIAAWGAASAAGAAPAADIWFCVDSEQGVELAEAAHRRYGGPPLRVLIELGYHDGRCGLRQERDAITLAQAVATSEHLCLSGVESYEGLVPDTPDAPALTHVDELLDRTASLAEHLAPMVNDAPILTAGGSHYFDRVVERLSGVSQRLGWGLCIRSGCYVTHDHGLYRRLSPSQRGADAPQFEPAIAVSSTVLSRPQSDRLIIDCGRRDVSYDADLPVLLTPAETAADLRLVALNDQHAHIVTGPECDVAVGDIVSLGISHPCTALERWRVLPLIDRAERVIEAMPTYF